MNEIKFYYHEQAWQYAFENTDADEVIATDGSVYKNSISNENLVTNASGQIGPAGDYTKTAGGVLFRVVNSTWENFFDTSIGNIRDGLKILPLPKFVNGGNEGGLIYYYYKKSAWQYAFS